MMKFGVGNHVRVTTDLQVTMPQRLRIVSAKIVQDEEFFVLEDPATVRQFSHFTAEELEFVKDVHTQHCCVLHGCKYGNGDLCTVEAKQAPQAFPCERCQDSQLNFEEQIRLQQWYDDPENNPATKEDLERWLRASRQ